MSDAFHIPFETFPDASSLATDEQELLDRALAATDLAYVPYSKFHVGCALQLENGEIMVGNNQENKAYPSSLCAERTVLYYCGSLGKGAQIRKLAIRARSQRVHINRPVTPCGACRQALLEYERMAGMEFVVLMQGASGEVLRVEGVARTLLPFSFDIDF